MTSVLNVWLPRANVRAICRMSTQKTRPTRIVIRNHAPDHSWVIQCRPCSTGAAKDAARRSVDDFVDRKFNKNLIRPDSVEHFRDAVNSPGGAEIEPMIGSNALPHPIWSQEEVHSIQVTHREPVGFVDRLALATVKVMRAGFDVLSGYNRKTRNEAVWLNRIIFLETVAGVPGMVAAMVRHLHSLRMLRRDHGWIHTLLEEAENERMHLMTALQLKQPSWAFRTSVVGAQGLFVTTFSVWYMISPHFCHRFVGYLEEEAVVTYTKCLQDIDNGAMQHWKTQPAPKPAIYYWKLAESATMRDVILAIRADEAHHRVVNHTLGSLRPDDYNPYRPGK